jgi:hypothetical protein
MEDRHALVPFERRCVPHRTFRPDGIEGRDIERNGAALRVGDVHRRSLQQQLAQGPAGPAGLLGALVQGLSARLAAHRGVRSAGQTGAAPHPVDRIRGHETNVEQFVKARPDTFVFPTAYDEDRWVAQSFRINATPTYVLPDAESNVVLFHPGGGVLQNRQFSEFMAGLKD